MADDSDDGGLSASAVREIIPDWVFNPVQKIRGVIFGTFLAGLANFLNTIFGEVSTVFLGSQPATFGAPNETWGIADVPVVVARLTADAGASVIVLVFDTYASVLRAVIPQSASPVVAPFAAVMLVFTGVVVFRIAGPALLTALQAGLEAIPVVGGPLATVLGRIRS